MSNKIKRMQETIESLESSQEEAASIMEGLVTDNQMLQRQIEDLDYLNLFEMNNIAEIMPFQDRKMAVNRLRRLRHDNPIAKQSVKLIVRFTLGRGIQWSFTEPTPENLTEPFPKELPPDQQSMRGIVPIKFFPDPNEPKPGAPPSPAPAAPKRAGEALQDSVENDPIRKICWEFWQDPDNRLAFTTHRTMQTMLDELVTDGEKFYACFESTATPYLKVTEVPLEEISEIIYDPNNRLRPVYYKRQYIKKIYDGESNMYKPVGDPVIEYYLDFRITDDMLKEIGADIKIPQSKINDARMRHVYINEVWTKVGKRGLSELYSSRDWFRVFREFMEGRAAINSAAQAISYIRKIKGGPSTVAQFGSTFGGLHVGGNDGAGDVTTEVRRLTRPVPSAVYNANDAVDLSWMKTDTGAQNAKEDAKMILATGGAGVGTMVHYYGEGGDANLATAQSMELPMVKSFEDWQQFMDDFIRGWFEYCIRLANDQETASEEIRRLGIQFPPIISQDVVKYTTAWAQTVRDIAPNNMAVRTTAIRAVLGVLNVPNIDGLMPEIEVEMQRAELQRQTQAAQLMSLAAAPPQPPQLGPGNNNGNGAGHPPFKPPTPFGTDANTAHLVRTGNDKASNGPKPA
jgi:hypothetical protein